MKPEQSGYLKPSGPENHQSRVLKNPVPQGHPSRLDRDSESDYQDEKNHMTHGCKIDSQDNNRTYDSTRSALSMKPDQSKPFKASGPENYQSRVLKNPEPQGHPSRLDRDSGSDSSNLVTHGGNFESQDDN